MRYGRIVLLAATATAALALVTSLAPPVAHGTARPLSVAVTTMDLASIVARVGGGEVETFPLFRGCILRKDLAVEPAARDRLPGAEVVVWSGFFNESAAIHAAVEALPPERRGGLVQPAWIDVSRDAARVNVPTSDCEGYVDVQFMHGDPFVWLNPENGAVIANNVADALARLRPERAEYFRANAEAFGREMNGHLANWREQLGGLAGVKVFFAQCGWQNLGRLGGPTIMACRKSPGTLPPAESLARQVAEQGVAVVVVDPNTPPAYTEAFRRLTKARVVSIPSSLADLPGAKAYPDLFDNLIARLQEAVKAP